MSIELDRVFLEAVEKKSVDIPFDSFQDAYNFRQRLYRYRETLRQDEISTNPIALVLEHFTLEVFNDKLRVSYEPTIWEKINDTDSGHTKDDDHGGDKPKSDAAISYGDRLDDQE